MIVDYDYEQQLRQLAARISIIAEAPGVSYIPSGQHMHDSKEPTTGRGGSLYEAFQARLSRADSPRKRRDLIEWTERQIKARTHTPPMPERSLKQRILEDYVGVDCRAVAQMEGIAHTTVWRWRIGIGLTSMGEQREDADDSVIAA